MENEERFAKLFRGYKDRYGQYTLTGEAVSGEKRAGRAKTVDGVLSHDAYARHVAGDIGIGVVPLTEDNTVHFCALDFDVYKLDDQRTRSLTHQDIALALQDDPLIVTRSKSNGIHVWLFSDVGVSAAVATTYLAGIAARLGVSGCEVFPKQTERVHKQDVGNWINLPYFGAERNAVLPDQVNGVVQFQEADLDTFLQVAESVALAITEEWLVDNTATHVDQRDKSDDVPLWFDGPPCLQTLMVGHPERRAKIEQKFERGEITQDQFDKQMAFTNPQLAEGGRNEALFNVGLYLRRRTFERDPDREPTAADKSELQEALLDAHNEWVARSGEKSIPAAELKTIGSQAFKGKWGYACSKQPLKQFCDRRACLKRRLGVGTGTQDNMTDVTDFTVITSQEPQYAFNVGTTRVYVPDIMTLQNPRSFAAAITKASHTYCPPMKQAELDKLLTNLFANKREEVPLRGGDTRDLIAMILRDFINMKGLPIEREIARFHNKDNAGEGLGGRINQVLNGQALIENGFAYFRVETFLQHFQNRFPGKLVMRELTTCLRNDLGADAKKRRFGPKGAKTKGFDVWFVEIARLAAYEFEDADD